MTCAQATEAGARPYLARGKLHRTRGVHQPGFDPVHDRGGEAGPWVAFGRPSVRGVPSRVRCVCVVVVIDPHQRTIGVRLAQGARFPCRDDAVVILAPVGRMGGDALS